MSATRTAHAGGRAATRPPAQTADDVAAAVRLLRQYRPLRPIDATIALVPSAMERKLDAIRRALGLPRPPAREGTF